MNRIFHARIAWYQYFLLVVLTVNVVGALWCKYILPAVLLMLMLIVVIEQIIHTVYTVTTDGNLEISRGRFIRKKVIPISEITTIQKYRSMKFGSFSVTDYLLIEYGKDKFASVMPVKEREFVELIEKKMKSIALDKE
ncbi:PH domain-containing protein [Bacteroides faecium]|uniref:PH domain-containing protein n=1 Tax=Bacteroides faecium TaxID=2715212 RepID=A0A6H0KJG6_9BACE|nr:PH domain-containing protein [Bacteroides faecium]QIU93552.1 PH domain-containing protein [Bacteroides faecium]